MNKIKNSYLEQPSAITAGLNKAGSATNTAAFTAEGVKNVVSSFFQGIDLDPSRWDKLMPYRFVVIDTNKGNSIVGGNIGSSARAEITTDKVSTLIKFTPIQSKWEFILPISPQQLSITDQYSINTSATLKGVLEEHNGVKFKNITINGTMGVWPYRGSIEKPAKSDGFIKSVFAGTLQAAQNFGNQLNRIRNVATTNHPASKPNVTESSASTAPVGFYLAQAFQQFLEQYAEAKKDPKNYGWRLVLDIPKQNQSFLVTPLQFTWSQSENKPQLVTYTLQLKAWRRIDLSAKISQSDTSFALTPSILQRALNTVTEARRLVSAAVTLIGAVRSDVEKPLDVLRQTALFIKDLSGAIVTAADLPFQIQQDYKSSIKESLNIAKDSIKSVNSNPRVRDVLNKISESVTTSEGLTDDNIASGQLGNAAKLAQTIDPSNNIFQSPAANFEIFNEIPVNSLRLNNSQQLTISNILDEAGEISVDDLRQNRNTIQELANQLADYFGAGDSYYSSLYSRPTPKTRLQPMTLDEYALLKSLYDTIQMYDILTATTEIDDGQRETNMEYVAGLANQSDIDFTVSPSKILVPVPFGLTIEQIAARYLKDPQRWIEIATLNNLREPYIDEDGFLRPLLSNGLDRNITISSIENLFVGQRVTLKSSSQPPSYRTILDIKRLSDTSFLITLDGLPNLDLYTVSDSAYLQAFLPGTTNSQQKIFIPTDAPADVDVNIIPPSIASRDALTGLSKVDLLLTEDGDLATNNYGDFKLAYGMTNIIQALKIKLGTTKGTNLLHPDFGLGIKPGASLSDINLPDIYASLNTLIAQDPRFAGISSLDIQLNGSAILINMGVQLAAQRGIFPIRFQLNN